MAERRSPRIQAVGPMKEMMAAYYLESKNAADNDQ